MRFDRQYLITYINSTIRKNMKFCNVYFVVISSKSIFTLSISRTINRCVTAFCVNRLNVSWMTYSLNEDDCSPIPVCH